MANGVQQQLACLCLVALVAVVESTQLRANSLAQTELADPIQTLPRATHHDDHHYEHQLNKIYKSAEKDMVVHQDKLERKILHLQEQVKALSTEVSDADREDAMEEAKKNAFEKLAKGQPVLEKAPEATVSEIQEEIGKVSALILFGGVMLSAFMFFIMNFGNLKVALLSWMIVENILMIFVAVMCFQAFDSLLEYHGFEAHHEVIAGVLHCIFLLTVAMVVSWRIKDKHRHLAVFSACGAHYISFAAVHLGGSTQEAFFTGSTWLCFLSVLVLFVGVGIVGAGIHYFKAWRGLHHQEFEDTVDELEINVGGMVLAFGWTMAVRYMLCGRYPGEAAATADHSALQRGLFLAYALLMTGLAFYLLPKLEDWIREESHTASRIKTRAMLVLSPFLTMCVAWGYLLWAEFEFYEVLFAGNLVMGRLVFSMLASFVCFSIILALGQYSKRPGHADANHTDKTRRELAEISEAIQAEHEAEMNRIIVNMLALIVAFSWARTLEASIEASVAGYVDPAGPKIVLATIFSCVVLPVYFYYLRPYVEGIEARAE